MAKKQQQAILNLRADLKELRNDFEALRKAWKDELVDLADLREQITNVLRRLEMRARRAEQAQEEAELEGLPDPSPQLDIVSQRVQERRNGLRSQSG